MANPIITRGTTVNCAIAGTYTRGTAGWDGNDPNSGDNNGPLSGAQSIWVVDDGGYNFIASSDANTSPAWAVSKVSGQNQLQISAPSNAVVGARYAGYFATDGTGAAGTYYYVVFDIVAAGGAATANRNLTRAIFY